MNITSVSTLQNEQTSSIRKSILAQLTQWGASTTSPFSSSSSSSSSSAASLSNISPDTISVEQVNKSNTIEQQANYLSELGGVSPKESSSSISLVRVVPSALKLNLKQSISSVLEHNPSEQQYTNVERWENTVQSSSFGRSSVDWASSTVETALSTGSSSFVASSSSSPSSSPVSGASSVVASKPFDGSTKLMTRLVNNVLSASKPSTTTLSPTDGGSFSHTATITTLPEAVQEPTFTAHLQATKLLQNDRIAQNALSSLTSSKFESLEALQQPPHTIHSPTSTKSAQLFAHLTDPVHNLTPDHSISGTFVNDSATSSSSATTISSIVESLYNTGRNTTSPVTTPFNTSNNGATPDQAGDVQNNMFETVLDYSRNLITNTLGVDVSDAGDAVSRRVNGTLSSLTDAVSNAAASAAGTLVDSSRRSSSASIAGASTVVDDDDDTLELLYKATNNTFNALLTNTSALYAQQSSYDTPSATGAVSSSSSSSLSELTSGIGSSLTSAMVEFATDSSLMASSSPGASGVAFDDTALDWLDIVWIVIKILLLGSIIVSAIFGNLLVIIAVLRHHRLRITTNYFIVSLALADILVALFAMTFNASVVISGRWLFDMWVCDFWNSCDVLFSTASIMHLSCISYDRYYAIIKPLDYPMKITTKRVRVMLCCVWISSMLISYIPIFTGIYTTDEAMSMRELSPDTCEWIVNIPYALISSTVSFWLPCGFMLTAYYKIYQEALKQEKFIYKTQQMANTNHFQQHKKQHKSNKTPSSASTNNANNNNNNNNNSSDTKHLNAPRHSSSASENNAIQIQSGHRNSGDDPESGSSTPTKRTISKMKREHKAAKTLGIIMGAFILCWLPFFIWYVASTICGSHCNTPKTLVDILFWVGYLNSAMNPIIYAYFNRDFREAFKETLRNIFCCCLGLQCLENQRPDAINFSCTYRSTMDVGLVKD